ncbi:fibronectin type III domain-containing protein [Nonlabens ulvanivorans]|uniref:fibronectin type III domain-containing protein n=1 Tax=Nonlabens ulvanivorans TaxID=906888 RepID=UPI0037CBE25F
MKHFYATLLALFTVSIMVAQCNYSLEMLDNFGDGWNNGAQISVTINGGTPQVYTVPNPPGNINTVSITVNDGDAISLDYVADAVTPGDNEFTLFDSEGIVVVNSGFSPATGNFFNGTATCPTCPAVSNITSNNVVADSAEIAWTVGGSEMEWIIEYGVAPYSCGSGGTQVTATSNPFVISGLSSVTTYDVYVIAVCGPGDQSACQGPIQLTTTESCPSPSNFAPVTQTANSVSFVWDANGNPSSIFDVEYGPSPYTQGSGGTVVQQFTAPFADVTGLSSDTSYDFYVRIDCGMGDLSLWAGPYTAQTSISCPVVTAIQATNISFNSMDIDWAAGSTETEWEVEYAPVGIISAPFSNPAQGTVVNVMTTPATSLMGLSDATAYDIYVRAVCDPVAPDYSSATLLNATTLCLPFTPTSAAPYLQDFESFATTTAFVEELCWSATSVDAYDWNVDGAGSTPSSNTGPLAAFSGVNYFYTEASSGSAGTSEAILNGPQFDLSGLTNPSVQFYYHMFGGQIGDLVLEVDDLTGSGWTAVNTISGAQQTAQGDAWLLQIVNLSAYSGQTIQIRFRAISAGTFEGDISLDDILVGELPPCPDPNLLSTNGVLDTSAVLAWSENGLATLWEVEVQPTGVAQGTAGAVYENLNAINPETVTGLTAETTYDYYVRSNCGTDGFSAWVGPFTFTTKCSPIIAAYIEDFETFTAGVDFVAANCWEGSWNSTSFTEWNWNIDGAGSTPTTNTGPVGANSGSNYFYVEGNGGVAGNEAVLLAPIVDISGLTAPSMQFASHMFGAATGVLHVDVNDGSGFVNDVLTLTGQQQTSEASAWDIQVVDLLPYNSTGTVQVRFRAERTETAFTGTSDIAIDDVVFDEIPACPQPSALSSGVITDITSEILWNENGSATAWSIEYGPCGFVPGDGTSTTVAATTNPFTISGLTSFTCYDYYITADCGMGALSAVSGPGTFTTECAAFTAPFLDTFEAFTATTTFVEENCWAADSDSAYDWNVDNNGSTPSSGTGPLGAFSGSNYFYTEASSGTAGDEARLVSPLVDITALTAPSVQFKYHMFGAQIGTLHVDVNDGAGWINDVDMIVGQQQVAQADDWLDAIIDLAPVSLTSNIIQVRLRAEANGTFAGDISIDDFRIDNIPTCPNISMLATGVVNSSSVELNWIAGGTEVEWVVEYREVGTTAFTAVSPNPTTPTTIITGLSSGTDYELCVSAVCGPGDISQQVCTNASTSPNYCSGDAFVDSGGASGDYQNSENITYNICPDNAGDVVYVNFTFNDMEDSGTGCFDGLTIYDGPDNTFPTINTPSGGTEWCWDPANNSGTGDLVGQLLLATSTSGCLTFVFESDGSVQRPGWSATVTCAAPPTCAAPSALTAPTVTDTTADLAWTAGATETEWDVEVGLPGFTPDTMTAEVTVLGVTPTPDTIVSGLLPNTDYEYYVRAVCGPGDTSIYIGPFTFTTACAAFTAPYFENFEIFAASTTFVEDECWSASATAGFDWNVDGAGSTPSSGTGPLAANSGVNYFYTEASGAGTGDVATLVSPLIDLTPLTNPSVEFFYHMFGGQIGSLDLEINDGTGWTNVVTLGPGQIQTTQADAWLSQISDLSVYAGATVQFRFIATSNGSFEGDISLDDFKVDELPACPNPSILTATNITDSTADLGWTENGMSTIWNIEYGPCGFTPGTMDPAAVQVTGTTMNPLSIAGLSSQTCYEFYVTSDCGAGAFSNMVGPFSFETACAAFVAPYTEGFETFTVSTSFVEENCWSTPQTTGYTWDVSGAGTGSTGTGPLAAATGTNFFFTEASSGVLGAETELLSPLIDMSALTNPALTFSYHMHGVNMGTLHVDVNDGNGWVNDVASFVGQQQPVQADPWITTNVGLGAFTGATIQVRFRGERGNGFESDMSIDDIVVDSFTGCLPPSNLAVSNVTSSTADVTWTAGGGETVWEYVNQIAGTGIPTGAGTSTMNTAESLSGLASSTSFEVYVRADCGMGNFSDWVGPFTYQTSCAPFVAPYGTATGAPGNDFTAYPGVCWSEGDDTAVAVGPNGLDGAWATDDFANDAASSNGQAAKINIWTTAAINDWLVTPEFDLGSAGNFEAIFDIAHTDFSDTIPGVFTADQQVQLVITDDGGMTWTTLQTWDSTTTVSNTGQNVVVDLSAYTGIVQLAFWGSNGVAASAGDSEFFVDNFTIDATASASSVEELGFTFYPNPVKDVLNINGLQTIDSASVMNMLGQQVMNVSPGVTNAQIDMTTLSAGVYLVQVTTDSRTSTIRVVKE